MLDEALGTSFSKCLQIKYIMGTYNGSQLIL